MNRLNLKRPDTTGFLQRWYCYVTGLDRDSMAIVWTPTPEPKWTPFHTVVVETAVRDDVLVRAELALMISEGRLP